jgi:glutamine amidotransferase
VIVDRPVSAPRDQNHVPAFGFRANEPTRLECSLVRAQNALMAQGMGDREGLTHGHGRGVAEHPDGVPFVERQAWAAYHGEHFKKTAARIYSRAVIAHVRRATVAAPSLENTHPFVHGRWLFAHNGTVRNFDQVRERLLPALDDLHRSEIRGTTDSGHVFRYLLTLWERRRPCRIRRTWLRPAPCCSRKATRSFIGGQAPAVASFC